MRPGRHLGWSLFAIAAAVLVYLAPPASTAPEVVVSVARMPAAATEVQDAMPTVLRIAPRAAEAEPLALRLWSAPAEQVSQAAAMASQGQAAQATPDRHEPPPPPSAPALPFRFIGRFVVADVPGVVLLGEDGQVAIARAGDALAKEFRIDSIAGNTMVVTYMPLRLSQSIDIGVTR